MLYSSTQHAREWISAEVNRRLLHWFIDQRKARNPEIVKLLKSTELWFVLGANPDGYQYTFDHERLWRKNLRDNDGDGADHGRRRRRPEPQLPRALELRQGGLLHRPVERDLPRPAAAVRARDQGRRGPHRPDQARVRSSTTTPTAHWLLYPQGWQVGTPDADDPIYCALVGRPDANPAIAGFDPGLSSDVLYVTNGETTDYAHVHAGTLAWTPELERGLRGLRLRVPRRRGAGPGGVRAEPAVRLDVARLGDEPGEPDVAPREHGQAVLPVADESTRRTAPSRCSTSRFDKSYGDPQRSRVLAKRSLGAVTVKYQINGGATQERPTTEWKGGERYGPGKRHVLPRRRRRGPRHQARRQRRGLVRGRQGQTPVSRSDRSPTRPCPRPATRCSSWRPRTTRARRRCRPRGRTTCSYYADALAANGIDVRRLRRRRQRPDGPGRPRRAQPLRRRHLVHRRRRRHPRAGLGRPGTPPGWRSTSCSRSAPTSTRAASCSTPASTPGTSTPPGTAPALRPVRERAVLADPRSTRAAVRCRGSGDAVNDVLQYWFGASHRQRGCGHRSGHRRSVRLDGVGRPVRGHELGVQRRGQRGQPGPRRVVHRDERHPARRRVPAVREQRRRPGTTGRRPVRAAHRQPVRLLPDRRRHVQAADADDHRAGRRRRRCRSGRRTTPSPTGTTCSSRRTPSARTTGRRCPTPTATPADATGESCPAGWRDLHPFLDHYQTIEGDGDVHADRARPAPGTPRAAPRAAGSSGGRPGAYAGGQVEISIAYVSDWATQGLGVFVDDIDVSTGEGSTSFETRPRRLDDPGPAGRQRRERERLHPPTPPASRRAP